jgi:hypothetical protein
LDTVQEAGRAPHGLTCLLGALIRPGTVSRNITHSLSSHRQCLGPPISGVWLGIRASRRAECSGFGKVLKPHPAGCRLEPPFATRLQIQNLESVCHQPMAVTKIQEWMEASSHIICSNPHGQFPHQLGHMLSSSHTRIQGTRNLFLDSALYPRYMHSAANACASYAGPCMRLEALQFSFQSHNTLNPSTYAS